MKRLRSVVARTLLCALIPGTAAALPGYNGLINTFCTSQGVVRVRYTDDGCTLCHHPGTFTSDPAHRVEPVWSEFELGRSNGGDYSFFCPTTDGSAQTITSADLNVPAPTDLPAPSQGGPLSHAEMAWMSLGYPTGHTKTEANPTSAASPLKESPASLPAKPATVKPVTPTEEDKRQLEKLRADLGISGKQQAAWSELQDAVLAVRNLPEAPAKSSAGQPLPEQLAQEQRHHALRIARLRAVNTALVRLNAELDERQRRLLGARLPALMVKS